jgi:chromosomal replication initiation ATPase DnaA
MIVPAAAAARAVATAPGAAYNPLFIYSDSGLGKTHLLHAIAHQIMRTTPGARVAIVSSERYTNDFVEALARGGPSTRHAIAKLRADERPAFVAEISAALEPWVAGSKLGFPMHSHVVTAQA